MARKINQEFWVLKFHVFFKIISRFLGGSLGEFMKFMVPDVPGVRDFQDTVLRQLFVVIDVWNCGTDCSKSMFV